jgi:hypothetical protein
MVVSEQNGGSMNNLFDQYAEYIMDNCAGDRSIGNGDALLCAQEQGYLLEDFCDSIGITVDQFEDTV